MDESSINFDLVVASEAKQSRSGRRRVWIASAPQCGLIAMTRQTGFGTVA
jgi:hypothetical protein